ncbi:MAG: ATP-binding protein, partial [Candidatus Methylumidiphilus sp.]
PAAAARRALAARLRQAQGLGDVARQVGDGERQIRGLSGQLAQALADLNLASAGDLRKVKPLFDADIAQAREAFADIETAVQKLRNDDEVLPPDIAKQTLLRQQLAAEGEVVTADTLRQARHRRDAHWREVRQACADNALDSGHCLDTFEAAQDEADRQADLLRADAKRAAEFQVCTTRIEQMEQRRQEIAAELEVLAKRAAGLRSDWAQRLAQAGLPALSAEALREWQAQRRNALDIAERHAAAETTLAQLQAAAQQAASDLADALKASGHPAQETAADLPALLEQAAAWDKASTEAQAKHEERVKTAQAQAADLAEIERQTADAEAAWQRHHARAQDWHSRLWLNPDSSSEAVKARLEELDAYARQAAALADAKLRLAQGQAALDEFNAAARQLADLLHEPAPAQADDFAENLRKRLGLSQQAETQRNSLRLELGKAEKKLRQAQAGHDAQTAALARLCLAAGVADRADLPVQEALAAQKRQAQENLSRLCQQLRQASPRTETELRQALADRDAIRLDTEREQCKAEIARLEQEQAAARQAEEHARRALEAIDASDAAARAREAMESAAARQRAALRPWARLRLAHALLAEALLRFRERAQAPMVQAASAYFELMTDGRYGRLLADEQDGKPVLRALRNDGARIGVEAMSEGTADQLYLALRLAALELRRASHPPMPLVLDDVLITSDDQRAVNVLRALAKFAKGGQVMLFTHHRHVLDLAGAALGAEALAAHWL